ncbi:MAG: TonB family protein [Cyclobacteriaceae bacterium]|nr:TonB family protein [Cyclobacteriaceae bacterium]
MNDYANDIERYLNGAMTNAERHAFEKRVLADPFLAEALEGAEIISSNDFADDVKALNEELLQPEYAEYKAVPAAARRMEAAAPGEQRVEIKHTRKISYWSMVGRVAAGLVIIAAAGYLIWQTTQTVENPDALALEETKIDPIPPPEALDQDDSVEVIVEKDAPTNAASKTISPSYKIDASSEARAAKESTPMSDEVVSQTETKPLLSDRHSAEPSPKAEVAPLELATEKEIAPLAKADAAERKKQDISRAAGAAPVTINQIHGRVTSQEDGSALPGVNVVIRGTTTGTITDENGVYQIESTQTNPALVFSFIGLQSTEVAVGERREVDVALSQDVSQLSEVVVTGYGISKSEPYAPTVNLAHPEIGNRAYQQYLEKNIRYPEEAKTKKVQGRVTVEFFVETDGSLTGFTVVRGIGAGCDEELIRLIKEGPNWLPTIRDNQPIREKARVRLKFDLPK